MEILKAIIEATILTRKFKGKEVLLPHSQMQPTDMPFEFKRLQFAFAMTTQPCMGFGNKMASGVTEGILCAEHESR